MIYVIVSEAGPVKVGLARAPQARLKTLSAQQPYDAHIAWLAQCPNGRERLVEELAHRILAEHRLRGEWFVVSVETAINAVDRALKFYTPKRRMRKC